jgi:uncharacterized protein (TIRG00374 family)
LIGTEPPRDIPSRGRRVWRTWVGLLVSSGCLFWIVRRLDWPQVVRTVSGANYGLVGLAILTVLLTIGARALRWAILVRPLRPSWLNLLSALVIGQVVNYALPARAGDLVRAYLLGSSESESRLQLLGTVAVEKVWDLLMVLVLVLLLSARMDLPSWVTVVVPGISVVVLAVLLCAFVSRRWKYQLLACTSWMEARLPGRLKDSLSGSASRLLDGLGGLQRAGLAWPTFAVSGIIWGLGGLTIWLILTAVGVPARSVTVFFLLVVLRLGVTVPTLPGRIGFYEGLCIVTLSIWGVGGSTAFSVGIILHTVVYLPPTLLAAVLGVLMWGSLGRRMIYDGRILLAMLGGRK